MRVFFKQGLVVFWFLWWAMAFLTDFVGGLELLGVTSTPWFDGHNYPFLVKTLEQFGSTTAINVSLFIGIILWALLSAGLFLIALGTPYSHTELWFRRVDMAFIVSLGLWLAFFLSDQTVMKFDLEENHMVQGGFQLLCYLTIYVLPD
ncbi:hypothetical protein [Ruegeria sp. Ofav3-42]|uniref:hypothetical protein n=1 Tax=Ruegeria sp. Ofav3-42 TaxID=2917759 RepID=UPI001EF6A1FF|nr:hypothetical protein [Ruegeria sp. Ofav3-42]MCG7520922.1 hypothetical protein [Ruegeria sp. Ofav3-42]